MRIARPRKPEAEFKRKRGPPPQATKLLRYSLAAGIVLMVLLGVVFLPQLFRSQPPVATPVDLQLNTTMGTRLDVVSVGAMVSLTKLNASLLLDDGLVATLGPPLGGANGTFSFTDSNGDGLLGPRDYFSVTVGPTGCHRMEIFQLEPDQPFRVGQLAWGACPTS